MQERRRNIELLQSDRCAHDVEMRLKFTIIGIDFISIVISFSF